MEKRKLATTLLAAASLTTTAASLKAVNFPEPGDAGQTLATASNTGLVAGSTLTGITGTIAGTDGLDADLYLFTVNTPITFTATSTGGASSAGAFPIDTSLFLFNSAGAALVANDDSANSYNISTFTLTLLPGSYYLGIALSGNEPVNANNQLLFTADQPTTSVRGPASGLNPTGESNFNLGTFFAEGGAYSIGITATAVPEPSVNAALAFGGIASLVFLRRLRRQQNA